MIIVYTMIVKLEGKNSDKKKKKKKNELQMQITFFLCKS